MGKGPDSAVGMGPDSAVGMGPDSAVGMGPDSAVGMGPDSAVGMGPDWAVGMGTGWMWEPKTGSAKGAQSCWSRSMPADLPDYHSAHGMGRCQRMTIDWEHLGLPNLMDSREARQHAEAPGAGV